MPTDPRLNSLVGYVQQSLVGDAQSAAMAMVRADANDLRQRVSTLERSATVQTGAGVPTQASRDGTLYIDVTASPRRVYVRAGGAWLFTTVA